MTTDIATTQDAKLSAPQFFAREVQRVARRQMEALLGSAEGQKAAQRITMAFVAAMAAAKSPKPYADAANGRPDTIATCVSLSAQTRLYPGGPSPDVYLVPQSGELQWRITHRGIAKLMARAGYSVMAVPVGRGDQVRVSMGELVEHESDPSACVTSLDDLLGVAVIIRRIGDGAVMARPWVPAAIILQRKAHSRMSGSGPWRDWPIEMAQKTAILYCAARGTLPAESPEIEAAVSADHADTVLDARVSHTAALPDYGEADDFDDAPEPELVDVAPESAGEAS